jgi:hypothetical protein
MRRSIAGEAAMPLIRDYLLQAEYCDRCIRSEDEHHASQHGAKNNSMRDGLLDYLQQVYSVE